MIPYSGVLKIARFNWPWYAAAVAITGTGLFLLQSGTLTGSWVLLGFTGLFAASFWLLISLAVSYYVYDRSPVSRGAWLDGVNPACVRRAAIFHAGQDEASAVVARVLPSAAIQVFDFHDPTRDGTPSLERARALAEHHAATIASEQIPLNDGTLDLALVVFAAHEIRRDGERAAFFRELARALAPTGRAVIVEHLRDGWNFIAYGPGALHFLSRKTWHRSFAAGGLKVLRETPCTPFVRVFELGNSA